MQYTSRDLRRYNHLLQETDAVYHEMAQHWGLPDSVMGVLYTLCDAGGRCSVREVCRLGGMSKQTVNSALRVIQAENQVFAAWPQADVEQYLALTRRFQEALGEKAKEIKEES